MRVYLVGSISYQLPVKNCTSSKLTTAGQCVSVISENIPELHMIPLAITTLPAILPNMPPNQNVSPRYSNED